MNTMGIMGLILLVVVAVVAIWVVIGSRRKKWYKVYLANNSVLLLYRDINERWWRTSDRYMRFKDQYGREVTFPSEAHWVLFWEEVPSGELDVAREEIRRMKKGET